MSYTVYNCVCLSIPMGTTQINFPGFCYVCVLCVFRLVAISSFKASTLSYSKQYYCVFIDWMRLPALEYIYHFRD